MKTEPNNPDGEPKKAQINVRIEPSLKQRAKVCALMSDSTLEEWVTKLVVSAVDAQLKGTKLPFNPARIFAETACAVR